ncbi:MAG TPA: RsmE family RNA methyltransferase [Candidatus Acidoferrales bacterium]|nr:RsmE family RNA methyltransferase [Candidatus Acidoferrales bacterium]
MRRRFFVDRFESNSANLRGEAAEHLGRVLRAEPGQLYELSDGQRVWLARIERVALSKRGENRIEFALVEPLPAPEPGLQIELLVSLVKFDRFEWCLEKATELGATQIVPLSAARTDKPLIAAAAKRFARWERIVLESAQQSRLLRPPEIHAPVSSEKGFAQSSAACKIFLSERREALPLREVLRGVTGRASPGDITTAALAIGPEGGWTDGEIGAARAAGFAEASLGETILRTETAVIASMSVLRFALID